ncbi:MAG: class I SAM-dependent methyltransferase [Acidimicrobiia bacterium]
MLIDLVRACCPPGGRVLDVAAAQGTMSLELAEAGFEVTWNDLRADLADYVAMKHEHGWLEYRPGNILDADTGADTADTFDVVLAAEILEHVAHPDELLSRLATRVRPGGALVISTPNGANALSRLPTFSQIADPTLLESEQFKPNADGHLFLLTAAELEQMARAAGLHVERIDFCQTYAAHAVERVWARSLRRELVQRLMRGLDRQLLRLPLARERLAVQLVAVFRPNGTAVHGPEANADARP